MGRKRQGKRGKGRKTGKGEEKEEEERKSRFALDTYLGQPTLQPHIATVPASPFFYRLVREASTDFSRTFRILINFTVRRKGGI